MGCGCGKKATKPSTTVQSSVARPTGNAVQNAQTYQSGTMQAAPQTARRTV